jgi:hypothetical protein
MFRRLQGRDRPQERHIRVDTRSPVLRGHPGDLRLHPAEPGVQHRRERRDQAGAAETEHENIHGAPR